MEPEPIDAICAKSPMAICYIHLLMELLFSLNWASQLPKQCSQQSIGFDGLCRQELYGMVYRRVGVSS
jgi:hypothetical protein